MKSWFYHGSALAVLLGTATAHAAPTYAVQKVQFPTDPTFTQLLGINDASTIVGYHGLAVNQGFTLTLPAGFINTNFPGSDQTQVVGISGAPADTKVGFSVTGGVTNGFVNFGPEFVTANVAGSAFNQVLGISNNGTRIAGYSSSDPAGNMNQQAYIGTADIPGAFFNGTMTNINGLLGPNFNSQATGINDAGVAVGFFLNSVATSIGFVDNAGVVTTLDPFGSTFTQALGIANSGEIVGFYTDGGGVMHGYIDIGGVFSTFDPAGSTSTVINGVNDLGQLVGFFTDANANVDGFVATPVAAVPEPGSLALVTVGLLGWLRKRFSLRSGE